LIQPSKPGTVPHPFALFLAKGWEANAFLLVRIKRIGLCVLGQDAFVPPRIAIQSFRIDEENFSESVI
jgi:hypothetical protein